MYFLLLFIIPFAFAIYAWVKYHEIVWFEALGGIALAAVTIFVTLYLCSNHSMKDYETWSGHASQVNHDPAWVEQWIEYIPASYDSKGHMISPSRTEVRTQHHQDRWWLRTNVEEEIEISQSLYNSLIEKYNLTVASQPGHRPNFHRGDRNDYISQVPHVMEAHLIPVNITKTWSNKLKVNPHTLFSFLDVSDEEVRAHNLMPYPYDSNPLSSSRIRTLNSSITTYQWDQFNSYVGPLKKVNVFLIEFSEDSTIETGHLQQSLWRNGKKNDLVICVGGPQDNRWSYVFGWSDSELAKSNIQSIILENELTPEIIPMLTNEIVRNYQIFDWSQLDHLPVPVPLWGVGVAFLVTLLGQFFFYWFTFTNDVKEGRHTKNKIHLFRNNRSRNLFSTPRSCFFVRKSSYR